MIRKLLIICALIYVSKSNIFKEKSHILAEYVKFVYENYTKIDQGYVGIVIISDKKTFTVDKSLEYIHERMINPIFLMNFNDYRNANKELDRIKTKKLYFGYLKLMIVFLEMKNNNMSFVLENLQTMPVYKRRCRLLLIVDEYINFPILKELFHYLWKQQFLNVAIAYHIQDTILQVYTYNPFFKDKDCLQNFTDTRFESNLFYNKLKNLNKHKLTCVILKEDDVTKVSPMPKNRTKEYIINGYDPEIIRNVVQSMNGTVEFVNVIDLLKPGERNPWRYTNDLEIDLLSRKRSLLAENEINMLNSDEMVLNDDFSGITESLYPHDKDDLVFVLKKGEKIPFYKYLFMIYTIGTWFALISILIISISFSLFVIKILKINWLINYLNISRAVICSALPKLPKSNSERLFIIFWFIYCFIIATSFQSILTSILMKPKYYPDITNLEQLDKSGFEMTVFRSMLVDIKKSLNGTARFGLINKMIDMPEKFDNVNYTHNVFTLELFNHPIVLAYQRAVFVTRYNMFCPNGKELLNIIRESPLPRYLAFQVSAGSPYLSALDEALTRFIESGHLIHWRKKWEHFYVLKKVIIPEEYVDDEEEFIKMTPLHLYSAFIILFSGQLISIVIFILELCKTNYICMYKK